MKCSASMISGDHPMPLNGLLFTVPWSCWSDLLNSSFVDLTSGYIKLSHTELLSCRQRLRGVVLIVCLCGGFSF